MIYFDSTMLLLIPAIILAFYAQFKVRNSYRKYSQAAASRGITGYETARRIRSQSHKDRTGGRRAH